jgi:hypothetical protein
MLRLDALGGWSRFADLRPTAQVLAAGIAGGLLIGALEFGLVRSSIPSSPGEQLAWLLRFGVHWMQASIPLSIALALLQHRAAGAIPSLNAYAIAVGCGAVGGAALLALHGKIVGPALDRIAVGFDIPWQDRFLHGAWMFAFWGSIGAMLHREDLRRRRGESALQAEELARLETEARLSEARLQSMRAQVEPEFLLQSLSAIERLYESNSVAADRALDALVRFLRQSIASLRRATSTFGDECRLLDAYARAVGIGARESNAVRIVLDQEAAGFPAPPGILLPIATCLLAGTARYTLSLRARSTPAGPAVDVALNGDGAADCRNAADTLERIARRLRACGFDADAAVISASDAISPRLTVRFHEEQNDERKAGRT